MEAMDRYRGCVLNHFLMPYLQVSMLPDNQQFTENRPLLLTSLVKVVCILVNGYLVISCRHLSESLPNVVRLAHYYVICAGWTIDSIMCINPLFRLPHKNVQYYKFVNFIRFNILRNG